MSSKYYLIVFEINSLFVKRICKTRITELRKLGESGIFYNHMDAFYFFYLRNHIKELDDFLNKHKIQYVFWSNTDFVTTESHLKALNKYGLRNHIGCFFQSDCKPTHITSMERRRNCLWVKDLNILSKRFNILLKNCLLIGIDDCSQKRDNNLHIVKKFNPYDKSDKELLSLIKVIKRFMGI